MKHIIKISVLLVGLTAQVSIATSPDGMVEIPGGSFMMGKIGGIPGSLVELDPYFMDEKEVTKGLWDTVDAWGNANGYDIGYAAGKAANHPAQSLQWYSAVKWCNARSEMDGLTPCYRNTDGSVFKSGSFDGTCDWEANGYRLPTEAEWEFAARGTGTDKFFPWLDSNTIQHSRANYYSLPIFFDTSPTRGYHPDYDTGGMPYTSPGGSFAPNAYGLYDMAGNVSEWVWDMYNDNPSARVLRGGSWGGNDPAPNDSSYCIVTYYVRYSPPSGTANNLGFRCAKAAGAEPPPEPSGFAAWADERGLQGDLNDLFTQDHDDDGVINGLEYAFGENLAAGARALRIVIVDGQPLAEIPAQAEGTEDASVWVEFNDPPPADNWSPAIQAEGTPPANRSWYTHSKETTPNQLFFKLGADLIE